jgi:hypothetical protein
MVTRFLVVPGTAKVYQIRARFLGLEFAFCTAFLAWRKTVRNSETLIRCSSYLSERGATHFTSKSLFQTVFSSDKNTVQHTVSRAEGRGLQPP